MLNKHFWKIFGGFLAILAFAVGSLIGFEYWKNYKEKKQMETLIRGADYKAIEKTGF